jgi:hypothetical protein
MTEREKVYQLAIKELNNYPNGLRYSELKRIVKNEYSDMKSGTITGSIRQLFIKHQDEIYKPETGLFCLTKFRDQLNKESVPLLTSTKNHIREEDFYESFSDWLINEVEECTKSISLGGNIFGSKWGTPDVIGILQPSASDIVKFEIEVTCAEIKLDTNQLITAFGQACSYRLFSHRVYLVIPKKSSTDEITRLDSLCSLFGIGLVLYDSENKDDPDYRIKGRAIKGNPDLFYVNKNLKIIEPKLFT